MSGAGLHNTEPGCADGVICCLTFSLGVRARCIYSGRSCVLLVLVTNPVLDTMVSMHKSTAEETIQFCWVWHTAPMDAHGNVKLLLCTRYELKHPCKN